MGKVREKAKAIRNLVASEQSGTVKSTETLMKWRRKKSFFKPARVVGQKFKKKLPKLNLSVIGIFRRCGRGRRGCRRRRHAAVKTGRSRRARTSVDMIVVIAAGVVVIIHVVRDLRGGIVEGNG